MLFAREGQQQTEAQGKSRKRKDGGLLSLHDVTLTGSDPKCQYEFDDRQGHCVEGGKRLGNGACNAIRYSSEPKLDG